MAKQKQAQDPGHKTICKNRRAFHDYAIAGRLEAGLVLVGSEVKSLREGRASLSDAYVKVDGSEVFLVGAHIAEYKPANRFNHDPVRPRKLLLKAREIYKLGVQLRQKGMAAVPLSLYFNVDGRVKAELGVGSGKRTVDRRHDVKEREVKREVDRIMRRGGRR